MLLISLDSLTWFRLLISVRFWAQIFSIPNTIAIWLILESKGTGGMKSKLTQNTYSSLWRGFFVHFIWWWHDVRQRWVSHYDHTPFGHEFWRNSVVKLLNFWQNTHYKQPLWHRTDGLPVQFMLIKGTLREILWTTASDVWVWLAFLAKSQSTVEHRCYFDV